MAYDNGNSGFAPRQMFQGNWKCSECGAEIKELPFEPKSDRPLFCRDCNKKRQASRPSRY